MSFQRRIYSVILRLHPADFRNEFGRDMARDFEDALRDRGFAPLLGDALLSLARQWAVNGFHEPEADQPASRHPLLAGQYATISLGRLTAFDLARASVLATVLFVLLAYAGSVAGRGLIHFGPGTGDEPGAGGRLAFDVASVKQHKPGLRDDATFSPGVGAEDPDARNGGYFSATNQELAAFILFAFKMPTSQYLAVRNQLPDWAQTERFDIQARAHGNPTKDQMRVMMQSLLADRFRLAIHTGKGQAQVYFLEPADAGKLGPHLRPHDSQAQCPDAPDARPTATISGGFPMSCGEVVRLQPTVSGDERFAARDVGMGSVATLANDMFTMGRLDRPVINRTGLSGTFDFNLEFVPTATAPPPPGGAPSDSMGKGLPQALKRQLGLKLVPAQGLEDMFVIDHVERPSEN
jgi:uncharacterized protein (TIGR03435 family)